MPPRTARPIVGVDEAVDDAGLDVGHLVGMLHEPPSDDRPGEAPAVTTPVTPGGDNAPMKPSTPSPERGDVLETTIFPARRKALSREDLQRALAPIVARWIRATCVWNRDAIIGDYRFVVFSIDVAPDVRVYVQFWAEPGEPVLWEVSSGHWNPPADQWLAGERSERIATFGFELAGPADNFRREVDIRTPKQAARVAATVVDIMYAAFDYRGLHDVHAQLVYECRAALRLVYNGFTPEDLVKVFEACQFSAKVIDDDDDEPVVRVVRRGITTTITCTGALPDQRLYTAATLTASPDMPSGDFRAIRRLVDDAIGPAERVSFGTTLVFDGGVTVDWLVARIQAWDAMTWSWRKEARRKARAARMQPSSMSEPVH
jgi:hypothetical protein